MHHLPPALHCRQVQLQVLQKLPADHPIPSPGLCHPCQPWEPLIRPCPCQCPLPDRVKISTSNPAPATTAAIAMIITLFIVFTGQITITSLTLILSTIHSRCTIPRRPAAAAIPFSALPKPLLRLHIQMALQQEQSAVSPPFPVLPHQLK